VGQLLSRFFQGRTRVVAVVSSVLLVATAIAAPGVWSSVAGNVGASGIEIDAPNTANLYPGNASKDCANANFGGSTIDWVKDCAAKQAALVTGTVYAWWTASRVTNRTSS
jgi:hypothetical protein